MYQIPLTVLPNQSIAFSLDGGYWKIHVYLAKTHMCADITLNDVKIVDGVRCFGGIVLMQYKHLHLPLYGNFVFDSDADWTVFGTECNLYYMDAAEFTEYNGLIMAGS